MAFGVSEKAHGSDRRGCGTFERSAPSAFVPGSLENLR